MQGQTLKLQALPSLKIINSQYDNMNKKKYFKKILLVLALIVTSVGISYVSAEYTTQPNTPPTQNTEQPLHVGADQEKKGGLSVGNFIANKNALFNGGTTFFGGLYGVAANDTVSTDQPTQIRFGGTYTDAKDTKITELVSLIAKGDITTKKDFTAESLKNPSIVNPQIVTLRPVCADNLGEMVICPPITPAPETGGGSVTPPTTTPISAELVLAITNSQGQPLYSTRDEYDQNRSSQAPTVEASLDKGLPTAFTFSVQIKRTLRRDSDNDIANVSTYTSNVVSVAPNTKAGLLLTFTLSNLVQGSASCPIGTACSYEYQIADIVINNISTIARAVDSGGGYAKITTPIGADTLVVAFQK